MDSLKFWHQFGNGHKHTESTETSALLSKYDGYVWRCDIDIADTPLRSACKVQLGMRNNIGVVIGVIILFGHLDTPEITTEYIGTRNKSCHVFSTSRNSLEDILQGWITHVDNTPT